MTQCTGMNAAHVSADVVPARVLGLTQITVPAVREMIFAKGRHHYCVGFSWGVVHGGVCLPAE